MDLADSLDERATALTVVEVAALLNVSERQVYKLAAENEIPSFRIGGSVRFNPSVFADWLREKMVSQGLKKSPQSVRSSYHEEPRRRA
jgi:excisionase family DNA binding protein